MNPQLLLFVGLGGAIGAIGRFVVMSGVGRFIRMDFPWGTVTVNLIGAFVLGGVLELSALAWSPSPEIRAMVVVGMLGAFTTFSTFSMDLYYLLDRGDIFPAAFYAMGSLVGGVVAFWAGLSLLRLILS